MQPPLVGDGADDRAGPDLVTFTHRDPVGGEWPCLPWPFGTFPFPTFAAFGWWFGCHQECLTVAGLQRQRRGDVGHRDVVLAFVVLDQLAEQLDSRSPEGVGDGIGEFGYALGVDVLDGGQLGFGERLPSRLFDRLEQVALPRRDEQHRGPRTPGPASASDAMNVGLGVVRDVVVQNVRYP